MVRAEKAPRTSKQQQTTGTTVDVELPAPTTPAESLEQAIAQKIRSLVNEGDVNKVDERLADIMSAIDALATDVESGKLEIEKADAHFVAIGKNLRAMEAQGVIAHKKIGWIHGLFDAKARAEKRVADAKAREAAKTAKANAKATPKAATSE